MQIINWGRNLGLFCFPKKNNTQASCHLSWVEIKKLAGYKGDVKKRFHDTKFRERRVYSKLRKLGMSSGNNVKRMHQLSVKSNRMGFRSTQKLSHNRAGFAFTTPSFSQDGLYINHSLVYKIMGFHRSKDAIIFPNSRSSVQNTIIKGVLFRDLLSNINYCLLNIST